MIMSRPLPVLWVLAALFCGAHALIKVSHSEFPNRSAWRRSPEPSLKTRLALAPVGAQVPECHPSVGDFIREDPELSIWLPEKSTFNPNGITNTADCPGDVPNGFTVFVPSNDAVPKTLAGERTACRFPTTQRPHGLRCWAPCVRSTHPGAFYAMLLQRWTRNIQARAPPGTRRCWATRT